MSDILNSFKEWQRRDIERSQRMRRRSKNRNILFNIFACTIFITFIIVLIAFA